MRGLFNGFREGYQEQRAKLGPLRPFFEWPRRPSESELSDQWVYHPPADQPDDAPASPIDNAGTDHQARIAELEAELQQRSAEMAELADYAEQMKARIAELESAPAGAESSAAVLRLPGVEKWLRDKFHPDKHPGADDAERRSYNEATQKINAAYSDIKRKKPPAA